MNGAGGFVRSYRKLLGNPAFRNDGEAMAFNWLILKAAWRPTRVRYKERTIYLQRGQLAISVRDMARALERPAPAIQRFLNRLKIETMIETRADTGVTIVTICNYALYQGDKPEADTPADTPADTVPIQGRYTEQEREESKEKDSPAAMPAARQSFLPADWQPPPRDELTPKARQCAEQWSVDAYERTAESFALYWHSRNRKLTDWRKAWAGWIIREHWRVMQDMRQQERQGGGEKTYTQLVSEGRA